jgi:hypothetical protein
MDDTLATMMRETLQDSLDVVRIPNDSTLPPMIHLLSDRVGAFIRHCTITGLGEFATYSYSSIWKFRKLFNVTRIFVPSKYLRMQWQALMLIYYLLHLPYLRQLLRGSYHGCLGPAFVSMLFYNVESRRVRY